MGIFSVFKRGLKKTRDEGITAQLDEVVDSYEKITPEFFDDLEEILIMGDVGMPTAERIIRDLKSKIENDKVDDNEIDGWYTVNSDYNKNTVARADWKVGEAEVSIEEVKFPATTTLNSDSKYVYCLVVAMPENMTNKTEDVAGRKPRRFRA